MKLGDTDQIPGVIGPKPEATGPKLVATGPKLEATGPKLEAPDSKPVVPDWILVVLAVLVAPVVLEDLVFPGVVELVGLNHRLPDLRFQQYRVSDYHHFHMTVG